MIQPLKIRILILSNCLIFVSLPNRDSLIQRPSSLPLLSHDFTSFCHKLPSGWMEERIVKRLSDFVAPFLPSFHKQIIRPDDLWKQRLLSIAPKPKPSLSRPRKPAKPQPPHAFLLRTVRSPQSPLDLVRCFLSNGEPAMDLQLFEFQRLPIPEYRKRSSNRAFFWNSRNRDGVGGKLVVCVLWRRFLV